jgi:toluene monooxygenase system ferredoxin subunit
MAEADTMADWQHAMAFDDLFEEEMTSVEVRGISVLILNSGGDILAYRNRCPHAATPLTEGLFEDGIITCPTHLWQFDAKSGRGVNPTNCKLIAFPAKVENGQIFVRLPARRHT